MNTSRTLNQAWIVCSHIDNEYHRLVIHYEHDQEQFSNRRVG